MIQQADAPAVNVWDRAVRCLHWALVLAVAGAWITTERWVWAHQAVGYVALGVMLLRLLWGFSGSRYARFAQFVRGPRTTWRYLLQLRARREPRYIGHNPLGGWMVLALLLCVLALGLTGWLYTTDWFWGDALVDALHHELAWALLVLAVMHVVGVLFTSLRHHENLLRAMCSGVKRAPHEDDVN